MHIILAAGLVRVQIESVLVIDHNLAFMTHRFQEVTERYIGQEKANKKLLLLLFPQSWSAKKQHSIVVSLSSQHTRK